MDGQVIKDTGIEGMERLLLESFVEGDQSRTIQFQILQSTGAGISKFVSVIEASVALLMAGEDGAELIQTFDCPGQSSKPSLVLGCHYTQATVAAIDDEESEDG